MFLKERRIDSIIKDLGFQIIARSILITRHPLYAVAVKGKSIFLIEVLENNKTDFINEHLLWMKNNMDSFLLKHHITADSRINLVCLYEGEGEINMEVPDLDGKTEVYNFNADTAGNLKCRPFNNYTLNIQLVKKMLGDISSSGLNKSAQELFDEIFTQRPLLGRKKSANCFVVDTLKEQYWLYFFRNFFWCHKGKAPFKPKKVLFKEELW